MSKPVYYQTIDAHNLYIIKLFAQKLYPDELKK